MTSIKNGLQAGVASMFDPNADLDEDLEMDVEMPEEVDDSPLDSRFLLEMKPHAIKKYKEFIKEQLLCGEGEFMVELGVSLDNSTDKGLTSDEMSTASLNHQKILDELGCKQSDLVTRAQEDGNLTKMALVRQNVEEADFIEVRVAVVGNVDAGKSTLLGVLTHNALDDGRGHARQKLFRHKHEFESGRTSSVGNDILGFDMNGKVVNNPNPHSGHLDWVNICRASAKVITFVDLAGHEKYLKTTIFGMTGHMPDYAMLMVGSNMGIVGTTKEHLSLALSLGVPVFIVVTKIDMCPPNILEQTMKDLDRLMKSPGARKRPIVIQSVEDVVSAAHNFHGGKICPIFQISNVLGTNLLLLRQFLNIIPLHRISPADQPVEFQIDDIYWVDGVGTVVSGTCLAGTISLNDNLLLGPDSLGNFHPVPIKSIHRKRMPVSTIRAGQTASFALRKFSKKDVRKGMVLVDPRLEPKACFQFEAEVLVLHHPTTIAPNYQAMVHVGSIRQTATIVKMNKEVLRTGDRDDVMFRFIRHPEYMRPGTRMVFREGRTKAVGTVRKIVPYEQPIQQKPTRQKGPKNPKYDSKNKPNKFTHKAGGTSQKK